MEITLPYGFEPRDYQKSAWNAVLSPDFFRGLLIWPRKNGKDLFSWNALATIAFQVPGLYFYIGPYYNQTREIIWRGVDNDGRRFLDYIPQPLVVSANKQDAEIEMLTQYPDRTSVIKLHGSDEPDRLVGPNPRGICYTEFSLQNPLAWDLMRPNLTNNGGWALFNGTVRGVNHFHDMAIMAEKNERWFYSYLTCEDTGYPSQESIEQERRDGMLESNIQREYYNDWTSSTEETFIPLDIITPTLGAEVTERIVKDKPRILGVDVAFAEKGDKAVLLKRQGPLVHEPESHQGMDNMALATRIVFMVRSWRPRYVCIDAGRGEGVISRLQQLGYGDIVLGVDFGGKTYNPICRDKKAEMWLRGREWFRYYENPSLPNNKELIRDLSVPLIKEQDRTRKIYIESKASLRSRGERSTDFADAFMLTFAEDFDGFDDAFDVDVTPDEQERLGFDHNRQEGRKYNPLTHMTERYG